MKYVGIDYRKWHSVVFIIDSSERIATEERIGKRVALREAARQFADVMMESGLEHYD